MKQALHTSKYEIILPLPNDPSLAVAVNGLYGAIDIITAEEGRILTESREQAASLTSLNGDTAKRLASRGHIVPNGDEWELENAKIISRLHWLIPYRKFVDIVIMPTYNCNFRCEYCFERARLERDRDWLEHRMTGKTLEALFAQLDALKARGIVTRKMILYGGEPLLVSSKPLVAEIIRRCRERGIHLVAVTNGYELNHFIELFPRDLTDFLQITVDGPAPVHDSRRFLVGGKGSFERIMENIRLAVDAGITVNVRTNVNRSNLRQAIELIGEYRRRGLLDDPHFHFYYKATLGCYEDDPENAITDEDVYHSLLESGLDARKAISLSRIHMGMAEFAIKAFEKEAYPQLKPSFCGAHSDMLVVDPDGVLYACWDMVSMEEHSVGFLDVDSARFMYNFNLPRWRTRTADNMEKCRQCPLIMLCGGGCAVESEAMYGDRNVGYCGSMKEAFADVAPLLCGGKYGETGEKSLSLSFYELFDNLTEEERQILLTTTNSEQAWEIAKARMTSGRKIFS